MAHWRQAGQRAQGRRLLREAKALSRGALFLVLCLLGGTGCSHSPALQVAEFSAPQTAGQKLCSPAAQPALPNLDLVKQAIRAYHDSGQWDADRAAVTSAASAWIRKAPPGAGRPALVLDVDETSLTSWPEMQRRDFGYDPAVFDVWARRAEAPAIQPTLALYHEARSRGLAVFFVSGRTESQRAATEKNLRSAGYDSWDGLYLRPDDDHERSIVPFKSGARRQIAERGYRILANVGDQASDLLGGYAERTFKLPNPAYYLP